MDYAEQQGRDNLFNFFREIGEQPGSIFRRKPSSRPGGKYRMTLGRIAIAFALIVVVSLNVILLLGSAGEDMGAPAGILGGSVAIFDVSLVVSSIVLSITFARLKRGLLSALFFGNLALFIVAAAARVSGISFRPAALFAANLYWLNVYLVVLARHWGQLAHRSA